MNILFIFLLSSSTYVLNACWGVGLFSFLLSIDFLTYNALHIARLIDSVACGYVSCSQRFEQHLMYHHQDSIALVNQITDQTTPIPVRLIWQTNCTPATWQGQTRFLSSLAITWYLLVPQEGNVNIKLIKSPAIGSGCFRGNRPTLVSRGDSTVRWKLTDK